MDDPTTGTEAQDVYQRLAAGPAHSFADVAAIATIPRLPGAYCIWDADGTFLYTGIAGRQPGATSLGLAGRLRAHASGRRSGDQFCVYVADRCVLPELSRDQLAAIGAGTLSFDALIRERVHSMTFRFAETEDFAAAMLVEATIKRGKWPHGPPRLNPARR